MSIVIGYLTALIMFVICVALSYTATDPNTSGILSSCAAGLLTVMVAGGIILLVKRIVKKKPSAAASKTLVVKMPAKPRDYSVPLGITLGMIAAGLGAYIFVGWLEKRNQPSFTELREGMGQFASLDTSADEDDPRWYAIPMPDPSDEETSSGTTASARSSPRPHEYIDMTDETECQMPTCNVSVGPVEPVQVEEPPEPVDYGDPGVSEPQGSKPQVNTPDPGPEYGPFPEESVPKPVPSEPEPKTVVASTPPQVKVVYRSRNWDLKRCVRLFERSVNAMKYKKKYGSFEAACKRMAREAGGRIK